MLENTESRMKESNPAPALPTFPQEALTAMSGSPERTRCKVSREFGILKAVIVDAAHHAFTDRAGETTSKVAISEVIGNSIALLERGDGFGKISGRTACIIVAGAAVADLAWNAKAMVGAIKNNWDSKANWDQNLHAIERSVGKFVVDTALDLGGGILGATLGYRYIPQVSKSFMKGIEPTGFWGHYLNQARAADGYTEALKGAYATGNVAKSERLTLPLQRELEKIRTYSEFVGDELERLVAKGKPFDAQGARRFLLGKHPEQVAKLDSLASELKAMSTENLTNPQTLDRLSATGKQIEDVVRGPGRVYLGSLTDLERSAVQANFHHKAGDAAKAAWHAKLLGKQLIAAPKYSEFVDSRLGRPFLGSRTAEIAKLDRIAEELRSMSKQAEKRETWEKVIKQVDAAKPIVLGPYMRTVKSLNFLTKVPNF